MSFPIHITNIYELLNEDGEPVPQVRTGASEAEKPTTRNTQARGTTQNAGRGNSQGTSKPQGQRDGQRRSNDNRPPRENRPPRSIDRKPNDAPVGGDFQEGTPVRRERSERTRDSAHRSSERRARNADQVGESGGKRVFDRRSGTGRGREQKKGGAGRGNWGKEGEEQTENWDTEENKETKEVEKVEEVPVEKDPKQEEAERLAREEEEKEAKYLTLDTYLKQRESIAAKVELPKERKANEGVDQKELSKWSSYQVLKKDEDEAVLKRDEAKEKSGKSTVPLDQVFNIRDPPKQREDRNFRGRGSRGGRGGNRGGRGGSRRGESAPNFDLNSFPTLAPKA